MFQVLLLGGLAEIFRPICAMRMFKIHVKTWRLIAALAVPLSLAGCSANGSVPTTPDDVVLTEAIPFCSAPVNGVSQPLLLDVARPKGQSKDLPVVLLVHGGGWAGGSRADYRFMLNALAKQNWVGVSVDYRLSTHSVFPAQIEDVKCAVRWIRKNAALYRMDTQRLVAMGGSAGAHLVALLGTTTGMAQFEGTGGHAGYSSHIDAMVLHGGPYDLGNLVREMSANPTAHTPAGVHAVRMLLGGNTETHSIAYRQASPVTYASPKSAPALFLHGENDTVVPPTEALRFDALLKSKGASSQVLIMEGAGHGDFGAHPGPVVETLVAFIKGAVASR